MSERSTNHHHVNYTSVPTTKAQQLRQQRTQERASNIRAADDIDDYQAHPFYAATVGNVSYAKSPPRFKPARPPAIESADGGVAELAKIRAWHVENRRVLHAESLPDLPPVQFLPNDRARPDWCGGETKRLPSQRTRHRKAHILRTLRDRKQPPVDHGQTGWGRYKAKASLNH
jgi:hypothetical protein